MNYRPLRIPGQGRERFSHSEEIKLNEKRPGKGCCACVREKDRRNFLRVGTPKKRPVERFQTDNRGPLGRIDMKLGFTFGKLVALISKPSKRIIIIGL